MAKRGAEQQITKDDESDSERGSPVIEGERTAPLPPVEGRPIRGLPKRLGGGGPGAAITSTPNVPTASPTASAFSGFTFSQPTIPSSNPVVFGSAAPVTSSAAAAPAVSTGSTAPGRPFGGLSFNFAHSNGPPAGSAAQISLNNASSTPFAFGSQSDIEQPAAPAPLPVAPKPFTNLSFGKMTTRPDTPSSFFDQTATPSVPVENSEAGLSTQPTLPVQAFGLQMPPVQSTTAMASSTAATPGPIDSVGSTFTRTPQELHTSQPTPPPEEEVSYYLSIRGLNAAFLAFLTQTLATDAFSDLSQTLPGLLKQYEQRLDEEATKAGWRPVRSITAATDGSSKRPNGLFTAKPPPAPAKSTFTAPAAVQMPAPPPAGTFMLPQASTSSSSSIGGFIPTASTSGSADSPFKLGGFGGNPASSSTAANVTPKKHSDTVTKLVEDVLSGNSDSATAADVRASMPISTPSYGTGFSPTVPMEIKKPSSLFPFGPTGSLKPATPESKTFTPSSTLEDATPPPKLGKFGPGGSQPQLAFGGAKPAFGAISTSPAAAAKPFAFAFGSGAAGAAPTFGFGNSTVGVQPITPQSTDTTKHSTAPFSFSATPNTAEPAKSTTPSFAFGNPNAPAFGSSSFVFKPMAPTTSAADSLASEPGSGDASGAPTPEQGSPSKNLAELVGEGEEHEDTVTEQRAKLYMSVDGALKAVGVGSFKLKRGKDIAEGGKRTRRLLMRVDGSGNILLNMRLLESFSPIADVSTVRFVGFDLKGQPATTALRLRNEDLAADLVNKLKAEVDEMKKEP